ncbi:hypothetical protein SDC9_188548 [bioreactor metagenome]|uniref:Uncharacterized protein n=1 Tax=bioreactor metagenome TaxID=1076179 RepID=A0A645HPN7_9ZZZZ
MLAHNLRRKRNAFLCGDRAVGPNFQGQLIIVCHLAYAGVLHVVIYLQSRRINGIDGYQTDDRLHILFIPFSGRIPSSLRQVKLHKQLCVFIQRCDVQIGIDDLHIGISFNVAGRYNTAAFGFNINNFWSVAV